MLTLPVHLLDHLLTSFAQLLPIVLKHLHHSLSRGQAHIEALWASPSRLDLWVEDLALSLLSLILSLLHHDPLRYLSPQHLQFPLVKRLCCHLIFAQNFRHALIIHLAELRHIALTGAAHAVGAELLVEVIEAQVFISILGGGDIELPACDHHLIL